MPLCPQRLLKDCESKAEAAKRPSAQQLPQLARGSDASPSKAGSGGGSASASDESESDDSADTQGPANGATAPAPAVAGASATASSAGEASSGSDGEAGGCGSGAEFVPDLSKLKKLGKRAGPGVRLGGAAFAVCMGGWHSAGGTQGRREHPATLPPPPPSPAGSKVVRAAGEAKEESAGKKKAAPAKKGKVARVWGDAPSGKGEPAGHGRRGCRQWAFPVNLLQCVVR